MNLPTRSAISADDAVRHFTSRLSIGFAGVACIWIGLILGVSFLATPAKFLAPSLPLAVALDVGRHTFGVFNKVEWLLGAGLLTFAVLFAARPPIIAACFVAVLIIVLETLWLLPLLDERIGRIIAGYQPPTSYLHIVYIALEIAKLITLAAVAVGATRDTTNAGRK